MDLCYQVRDTDDHGKVVIATRCVLPGEIVLKETALLFASKESVIDVKCNEKEQATGIPSFLWAVYFQFEHMSPEKQNAYCALFSPLDGLKIQEFKGRIKRLKFPENVEETCLKVFSVFFYNGFGGKNQSDCKVFGGTLSRLSHSCQPNCYIDEVDGQAVIRCILPIEVDEQLTFSYDGAFNVMFTSERRAFLQRAKEFNCECPRCRNTGESDTSFSYNGTKLICYCQVMILVSLTAWTRSALVATTSATPRTMQLAYPFCCHAVCADRTPPRCSRSRCSLWRPS
jgi:hypothetical protein